MATKYSSIDILNMSEQRSETLTPYQRKLVRAYREPVTTAELSRVSGIDEDEIMREIRNYRHYGLNPNTLHYVRGLGYTIDTNAHMGRDSASNKVHRNPETLIAVTVATQSGVILQFWHPETIARWQAEVDAGIGFEERNCPPLDADIVQIILRPEDMKKKRQSSPIRQLSDLVAKSNTV